MLPIVRSCSTELVIRLIFELAYFTLVNQVGTAINCSRQCLCRKWSNSTCLPENFLQIEFVSKVMICTIPHRIQTGARKNSDESGAASVCAGHLASIGYQNRRSTIIFLISAMAFAGLRPLGQVCAQFMIVWQR
jgi:hypothetical protein